MHGRFNINFASRNLFACLLWLSAQPHAGADALRLAGEQTLEGIVVRETKSQVRLRVAWAGYVTVNQAEVVEVIRTDAQDHQRLVSQWRDEHLEAQQREQEREAFETSQREQGLVEYQGQWVTKDELALLLELREHAIQKERQRHEEELQRLAQRFQALEEENRRLRDELARQQLFVVRSGFLVQHAPVLHQRNLVKDEHGNLIRVREHEDHQFFTTTDGAHVDLNAHGNHLAFTDEQGIHHDLAPLAH